MSSNRGETNDIDSVHIPDASSVYIILQSISFSLVDATAVLRSTQAHYSIFIYSPSSPPTAQLKKDIQCTMHPLPANNYRVLGCSADPFVLCSARAPPVFYRILFKKVTILFIVIESWSIYRLVVSMEHHCNG